MVLGESGRPLKYEYPREKTSTRQISTLPNSILRILLNKRCSDACQDMLPVTSDHLFLPPTLTLSLFVNVNCCGVGCQYLGLSQVCVMTEKKDKKVTFWSCHWLRFAVKISWWILLSFKTMLLYHVYAVILVLFLAAPRRLRLRLASASVWQ